MKNNVKHFIEKIITINAHVMTQCNRCMTRTKLC